MKLKTEWKGILSPEHLTVWTTYHDDVTSDILNSLLLPTEECLSGRLDILKYKSILRIQNIFHEKKYPAKDSFRNTLVKDTHCIGKTLALSMV